MCMLIVKKKNKYLSEEQLLLTEPEFNLIQW